MNTTIPYNTAPRLRNPFLPTKEQMQTARKIDILLTANYTARTEVCADLARKVYATIFRRKDLFRGVTKMTANRLVDTQKMILIQNETHLGAKMEFVAETADRYGERVQQRLDNLQGMYARLFLSQGLMEENANLLSHLMVARYFVGFCETAGKGELAYMLKVFHAASSLKGTQDIMHGFLKSLYNHLSVLTENVARAVGYAYPVDSTCTTPLIRKWQRQIEDYVLNYNNVVSIVEELDTEFKEQEK